MTNYLARLKALKLQKRYTSDLTEPTKPLSSVMSASRLTASAGSEAVVSVLSAPEVSDFRIAKNPPVDLALLKCGHLPDGLNNEPYVNTDKKTHTKQPDKTDETVFAPVEWAAKLVASGLPPEWAMPLTEILCGPPPGDFDAAYWRRLLPGARIFIDQWAAKAYQLGWTAEDVFGLDEIKPAARYDRKGLAWLLIDGARVIELDLLGADIITRQGSRQRYYRAKMLR